MIIEQVIISAIILATVGFFIWGRWRYDIVALSALFIAMLSGIIPLEEVFDSFVHPVVVLVVAMIIISKGLVNAGVIDIVARYIKIKGKHPALQLAVLVAFTAFLSAFINSMGALAFVVPIAIRVARQTGSPISMFLMPLAFASHFGGSITLVGSVSNIIVSGFSGESGTNFGFFDFSLVALPIAVVSIIFIILGGWRLIPKREDVFVRDAALERYITEVKILPESPAIDKTLGEFRKFLKEDIFTLAMVRNEHRFPNPSLQVVLSEGDILLIETDPSTLESIIATGKLELIGKEPLGGEGKEEGKLDVIEVVVTNTSPLIGQSASDAKLRTYHNVNLLALYSRKGTTNTRMRDTVLSHGDILILQGDAESLARFIKIFSLLPLKERELNLAGRQKIVYSLGIFILAITTSISGFFPVHIIFVTAALLIILIGLVPAKEMYQSVDISVIVLLAAMLKLGSVFYETGTAAALANSLFVLSDQITPVVVLGIIFGATILLSDILSNATVAILFAPVALALAETMGVSTDPFLMAVAIGSASSYLTPIGHQSNIFIMGIGGYKFGDYWRLGLPLEIISFIVGMFAILKFWPF